MPSIDLMVYIANCHKNGLSFRKIETLIEIPKSTAHRWYTQCFDYLDTYNDTSLIIDLITSNKQNEKNHNKSIHINKKIIEFIKKSLSIQPFQTVEQLQNKIERKFNINLPWKTVCLYIKLSGFSKKKITKRLYNKDLKEYHKRGIILLKQLES